MTDATDPAKPLIVQRDLTVLLDASSPEAVDARVALARFAELERAPEHVHTYRMTPLSLWNAASTGMSADEVVDVLRTYASHPVAPSLLHRVADQLRRYGRVRLVRDFDSGGLALVVDEPVLLAELHADEDVASLTGQRLDGNRVAVRLRDRGALKQALLRVGWPVADEAGYEEGERLDVGLRCELRTYQADAVASWWADGSASGGSGVVVLPCGAGKTVVALAALAQASTSTLVLTTSILAARQWIAEALAKTDLAEDDIGEWSGDRKDLRPVTVATYQVLTWRQPGVPEDADLELLHPHLALFSRRPWGLVVYDEVHLLPAPVFRATGAIQAIRRLGLTATLVREDGREGDVFALVGPTRFDVPWRDLEARGWVAPATCAEVRVELGPALRERYATAPQRSRYRLASTAPGKLKVLERLVERHRDDRVLVIGQYLDQLEAVATYLGAPLVTGRTAQSVREERFRAFRDGDLQLLVVSKVANASLDLPEANVAIQLSGAFGSRQEEAQRLGRILRPKADGGEARFYAIVARDTLDQSFAAARQRFLAEQGYRYDILDASDV